MTCGIYKIENKQTGECYIGQSVNIEQRWQAHKNTNFDTSEKMLPLMKLAKQNPDAVDWSIIHEIPSEVFFKDELKFVLSVYEKYEVDLHGGIQSDNLLNIQPISIPAVPPSILTGSRLPDFVKMDVVSDSIVKWYDKAQSKFRFIKSQKELYETMYGGMITENAVLSQKIEGLQTQIKEKPTKDIKETMAADYEIWKLKKEIHQLKDEKEALNNSVSFWKDKCEYWRNLYLEK